MVAPVNADKGRMPASLLKITAAVLVGWAGYEGFSAVPYVPTKGDRPTIGNGATHYEDGRPVTMADPPITRERAAELTLNLLEKQYAVCTRKALGETLVHQVEFELGVDFAGQYGCAAWANSQMVRRMRQGDYYGACQAYISYRFITDDKPGPGWVQYKPGRWKYDCATPGNKVCRGVWTRQLDRYMACMAVQ